MHACLLDASIPHKFCASPAIAEKQAAQEAADTCGTVFRIKSIRIEPSCVVLTGLIPSTALVFAPPAPPAYLPPRSIGDLHLTWSTLLHPGTTDDIGYLVL